MLVDDKEFVIDINGFKVGIVEVVEKFSGKIHKTTFAYSIADKSATCCEQIDDKFYWTEDGYDLKKKPANALIIERALALYNLTKAIKYAS